MLRIVSKLAALVLLTALGAGCDVPRGEPSFKAASETFNKELTAAQRKAAIDELQKQTTKPKDSAPTKKESAPTKSVTDSAPKPSDCSSDVGKFCAYVKPGGGLVWACMNNHKDQVGDACGRYVKTLFKADSPKH
jgi:hypothetical protein